MSFLLVTNGSVVGHYPTLVNALIERVGRTDQTSVVEVVDPVFKLAMVDWQGRAEAKPGTKLFLSPQDGLWSESPAYTDKRGVYLGNNKVLLEV